MSSMKMSSLEVHLLPALTDNYIHIVHDRSTRKTMVIDPSTAQPVFDFLASRHWQLDLIVNTHHHWDHIGGNTELKHHFNCPIFCSSYDFKRIAGADRGVEGNMVFEFGSQRWHVIDIPGHTLGHIAIYCAEVEIAFVGDTLFSLGCGRLFEGTPEQMWQSLQTLRALPDSTQVYCGHEYTLANSRFALTVDPENEFLPEFVRSVTKKTQQGTPTLPSTIAIEKQVNPFLRADSLELSRFFTDRPKPGIETFQHLRSMKDSF